eukprot:TRINITY_DN10157_c0_g1_i1.p1 TRINITY_DN10157_c0_g1~~TRINITY_DN10157_c0_g1_i1.p1  ORF type:complete len:340 (+),score=54.75 TRINITY_DN10157_c0_g1_i1:262-1281(+)
MWNFMFRWHIRRHHIAHVLKKEKIDIVGLQELRQSDALGNQLDHLRSAIGTKYFHGMYFTASYNVDPGIDEGIGLLSRYPIIEATYVNMSRPTGPDTVSRIAMRALIQIPMYPYQVLVYNTHWSYDKQTQHQNVNDLLQFIGRTAPQDIPVIVLGDFNAYSDFEDPIVCLKDSPSNRSMPTTTSKCLPQEFPRRFRDVWKPTDSDDLGLTFSNMPWPGMQSRPDRIFVSSESCLREKKVDVLEDGSGYRWRYYWVIIFARLNEWWNESPNATRNVSFGVLVTFVCLFSIIRLRRIILIPFAIATWILIVYNSTAFDYIGEEFFPSDHRLLVATFSNTHC